MRVSEERLNEIDLRCSCLLKSGEIIVMNIAEMQAIIRELRELRGKYAELLMESFHQQASDPCADGWFRTNCTSSNCLDGDELVALGLYEKHPDGVGRAQKYRPIERTPHD